MLDAFQTFIQAHGLCQKHHRVGVAVSGGIDSMVLLHLFRAAGFTVDVLHVHFGLRGEASDADEQFVNQHCAQLHIPYRLHRVNTKSYATTHRLSVQEAARTIRYAWFREQMQAGIDCVATAHHQSDSIETFFINLLRGTGLSGLTGIPVQQDGIIRPLLFATRAHIEAYAAAQGLTWREDATNQTDIYQRNKIRLRLLPLLNEMHPGWQETFGSTRDRLAGAQALVNSEWQRWFSTWDTDGEGATSCPVSGLLASAAPALLLWETLKSKGFSFAVCKAAVAAAERSVTGKRFESPSHTLWIDRGRLVLKEKSDSTPATDLLIFETDTRVEAPWGELVLEPGLAGALGGDRNCATLDAARLVYPLRWRRWQPGDRFEPLGMNHTKKVSDFLIDEKVPLYEKEGVTVLESGSDIVWVVGHRISERFRIRATPSACVTVRFIPR